jgi:DedD protein
MAAEQLTDQEKEFRRRARRRLIGAVALVLLMVTVLPWFLDDRSDQNMPPTDVAISIPSQDDNTFSSKIVPVAPASTQAATGTSPASAPSVNTPPATPVQPVKTSEKPVQLEAPLTPTSKEPVQKSDQSEKPVVEKPVAEKPVNEKPIVDKPVAEKSAPKKGMVSVQIGVFSDSAKVKLVQAKIAALGLQTSTETLPTLTGPKLRMRSGPYATKAEAEQALETLKGAGFSPILVTH